MPELTLSELRRIEAALVDLGACDDAACTEPNCTHALVLVREKIAAEEDRTGNARDCPRCDPVWRSCDEYCQCGRYIRHRSPD